ncbi:DUF3817 domain-containing protein [Streptomyces sp. NPDC046915]|uniref:DUF3817 domain-containing protein n=1 Tax=Streptomyces sp. NPDC046915 TaxID=3155257 RepID=UPI0033FD21A9
MPAHLRPLRIAAHAELISLVILLGNLATAHLKPVSSLVGPAHGCAYLFVVGATWRLKGADRTAGAAAFLPGVGGLLALRLLTGPDTARHHTENRQHTEKATRS